MVPMFMTLAADPCRATLWYEMICGAMEPSKMNKKQGAPSERPTQLSINRFHSAEKDPIPLSRCEGALLVQSVSTCNKEQD